MATMQPDNMNTDPPKFYLPPVVKTQLNTSELDIIEENEEVQPEWHLPNINQDGVMFSPEKIRRPTELKLNLPPLGKPEQKLEKESVTRFSLGDSVIYQWLRKTCEGCEEGYPAQRDHACLNYGWIENLNSGYFRDFNHLIKTSWIVGASRIYLKDTPVHIITEMVEDLRRAWTQSPKLSSEAMEKSTLDENLRWTIENKLIYDWMEQITFPETFELTYEL
ncbi:hypothetical protein BSL78_29533 [Apostichopus japonicus]|uniref:Uncharacterized protein n=1 Tax=Stichopus japonicus TaxID=307972 RepID=A0A2G8JD27_STIJA|nr:hypothetical protein BSL78_29533 [Apostichopus japonicus]